MTAIRGIPIPRLLSAGEFAERHAGDRVELIDGIVVESPMPFFQHGKICLLIGSALLQWVMDHDLGHVASNDSFVRTGTDPDSVRGPDICYYAYERLPRGRVPDRVMEIPPDLVVEVRSPSDRWPDTLDKVNEYLNAGVTVVLVADVETETIRASRSDGEAEIFRRDDTLTLPDILPGFSMPVARLFA